MYLIGCYGDGVSLANKIHMSRTTAQARRKYTRMAIRSKNSIWMPSKDGVGVRPTKMATKGLLRK